MTSNYSASHYFSQVCLDFGNDECTILRNFRGRIASTFEVIETPHRIALGIKNLGLNRVKQRA